MRFAVVGAGAIGAYLGARLSLSGHDVFLIARGPHLRAMQSQGVRVRSPEGDFEAHPAATDDYEQVGEVDFVFLTVKAHSLLEISPRLGPLLGPGDSGRIGAERNPVVVLPTARRALGRKADREA